MRDALLTPPTPRVAWIDRIKSRLAGFSETAGLDAQVLLASLLGKTRAWTLAHPEVELTALQMEALEEKLLRLERGEPLPYVLGEWEFYGLNFYLSPAVLIPRPETELLVETALSYLRDRLGPHLAADVGTGSGCIAVALAANIPDLHLIASDVSRDALELAKSNAARHSLEKRFCFLQADLLPTGSEQYDLICANLPYIPSGDLDDLQVQKWEPRLALDGGVDGLRLIKKLLKQIQSRQKRRGLILVEIEARQGAAAEALGIEAFPAAQVEVLTDLAGHDRLLCIQTG